MAKGYRARPGKIVAGIFSDLIKQTCNGSLSLNKNTLKSLRNRNTSRH